MTYQVKLTFVNHFLDRTTDASAKMQDMTLEKLSEYFKVFATEWQYDEMETYIDNEKREAEVFLISYFK